MKQITDDVWMLPLSGGFVNAYLVGEVLVDSGMPWNGRPILEAVRDRTVSAHVITHAHPDHMGSSNAICERLGVPFWAGERDVPIAEDPGAMARDFVPLPRTRVSDALMRATSGPGRRVDRALREGDAVDGFAVIDTPGHTRGHISLWREADRTLIVGDALWNFFRLTPPARPANVDNRAVRESVRKLAALEPAVACFGHGPVLRDPDRIKRLAQRAD